MPYVRRHGGALALGFVCLVAFNAMQGAIPWLTMHAVDGIKTGLSMRSLGHIVLLMIATALVASGIRLQSRLSILGVSRKIAYDLRRDVFDHLLRVKAEAFDRMPTGDIMSRLTNDLMLVRGLTGPGFMYLANTVLACATAISYMTALDGYLTTLALIPFPFFFVTVWLLARRIHLRQRQAQEELADVSSRVQEDLNGIWVIKAHARERFAIAAYEEFNARLTDANMRLVLLRSLLNPVMTTVGSAGSLMVLWLGGLAVVHGRITLGGLIACFQYLGMIAAPTVQMGWVITLFQRARVATARIQELFALAREEPVAASQIAAEEGLRMSGAIEVRDLTFRYPGAERDVLRRLTLTVPAGATYGIYGPTGSGKSTLLRLLLRLYDPPAKAIWIGGKDVTAVSRSLVRRSIAYVPQDPFLFRTTIRDNVAFAGGGAGDVAPAVEQAAAAASIDEEIAAFTLGYDTELGERGITLSGGQRARVTLARALYERRPLLVLDDPFASVDVNTEHEIIGSLRARARGVTTLLVTHRVKALANADRVLVMEGGRIVDEGTHDELLARPGPYLDAFREQRLVAELESL